MKVWLNYLSLNQCKFDVKSVGPGFLKNAFTSPNETLKSITFLFNPFSKIKKIVLMCLHCHLLSGEVGALLLSVDNQKVE